MTDIFIKEEFEKVLEESFHLEINESHSLTVTLVEVTLLTAPPGSNMWSAVPGVQPRQEPFSLIFQGSLEQPLNQGYYPIKHEAMEGLEGLFLVPVGMDENGRYYEAIIN